jgi:hypothetical protein
MGLDAIGVEIKPILCRNAKYLQVDETNERNNFVWKKAEKGEESGEKSETGAGEVQNESVVENVTLENEITRVTTSETNKETKT